MYTQKGCAYVFELVHYVEKRVVCVCVRDVNIVSLSMELEMLINLIKKKSHFHKKGGDT